MGKFDIYFSGELKDGASLETARSAVGRLFRLEGEALERLFTGKVIRVKKGVDADTAGRYRAAFRDAGALVEILPEGDAPPSRENPTSAKEGLTGKTHPPLQLLPPRTGSLEDCALPIDPPQLPDISWMELDLPGVTLDETAPPPAAHIDTSGLSMSEAAGYSLEDCANQRPARPIPDISHLVLDGREEAKDNR